MDPFGKVVSAYDHSTVQASNEQRRSASIAATFVADPRMEMLARMAVDNPDQFARLSSTTRMELGYYRHAKAAHTDINTPPDAA